jgi:hypothetical protein
VSFLSRGRAGKESDESLAAAAPAATGLSVVEFWAAGQRTLAGMDLSQGRLTDLINRQDILPVVLLDDGPEDRSQPIGMNADQQWTHFLVWDALLIVPPPQPTDPSRRLHRPRQRVEIVIGPFVVTGMVHVPAGAQAAGFMLRQNLRFAPVTRAVVRKPGLARVDQHAAGELVNKRRIATRLDVAVEEPAPID